MNIFCTPRFRKEYLSLISNKTYRRMQECLFDYLFNKTLSDVLSGTKLNGSCPNPYIKKRLCGRGGYRLYYLVIPDKNNVFLLFIHPKTGSAGFDNISDETKSLLYKEGLDCIETNNLSTVSFDAAKNNILFD